MKTTMKVTTSAARGRFMRVSGSRTNALPERQIVLLDGRVAVSATMAADRRRAAHTAITRASYAGQSGYSSRSGGGGPAPQGPGPRRIVRRPRDLQQLVDILSGGSAEDPEQFLQLLSAAPRVMERRRAPAPPQEQAATGLADSYRRHLQQQAAAAAAVEAARRRAQQEQEEETRREALRASMLQNARRYLPQYDAASMARLASGLAAAGVRDPALCDAMVRQLMVQRQQQQPQDVPEHRSLTELLDAFAAMRHRPSDAELAELLRLQQQQQQRATDLERLRQQQAQQTLRSQPRFQPRGMVVPEPKPQPAAQPDVSSRMSPEDAARLLCALSRVGYSPDEGTLTQLLEQLQPQRLQLQPTQPLVERPPAASGPSYGRAVPPWQQQQQAQPAAVALSLDEEGTTEEGEEEGEEDQLSYSLQRDAQAVASAVRALERMGRVDKAHQLRERFTDQVADVQARLVRERQLRRQEAEAAARRDRQQQEMTELQRRQRQEDQAKALRSQLVRKLRNTDQWQQIKVLLFTYKDALDVECITAAASRLAELLAPAHRTGRGLMLRDRSELGDLLEELGELALRKLDGASASQAASLLTSVVRIRYLDERLLVGLLRRLRDTLGDATSEQLAAVLEALTACGVRPSAPWMETFLTRCEDLLEEFAPEQLAGLAVSLAQLGAHPGRSWLGSYLDVLQERESELSQSMVSEAVRAVAVLDRPFLSAWRQAAAVRQQAQAQARAMAVAAAQQQQREKPTDALASVDETLSLPELQQPQPEDAVRATLPPMHPKQSSLEQPAQGSSPDPHARPMGQAAARPSAGFDRLSLASAAQSIELDVDAADLSYGDASAEGALSSIETGEAAAAASPMVATSPPAVNGRQLPGSYSVDGYYSPNPYDEYGNIYDESVDEDEEQEEGEEGDEGEDSLDGAEAASDLAGDLIATLEGPASGSPPTPQSPAGPTSSDVQQQAPNGAVGGIRMSINLDPSMRTPLAEAAGGQQVPEQASAPSEPDEPPPPAPPPVQQQQETEEREVEELQERLREQVLEPKPQPSAEELVQVRALRSLLQERYEAAAALRDELEQQQRRSAGAETVVSDEEVAAAARYMIAREQLQRLQADFENFQRRANLEKEQSTARVKADVLKPLLGIADNFERAATQIKPKTDGERAVHNTYQAVYGDIKELLKKEGLEEVGAEGEAFDPNLHEAVMREDRDDVPDGTVTCVFQKGYRLGELLVRPALVKVAYS